MTVSCSGFSVETLTLPHEDPAEHRRLYNEWISAYPCSDPIEQGFIDQAVAALVEKRRIERSRATLRTERVRTAELLLERRQEDDVARILLIFNENCCDALRTLTRCAAGCRFAIETWEKLQKMLDEDGTWYGANRLHAIQLQGVSACLSELFLSEDAFMTWLDCLVAQPNPKQKDIDRILDPKCIPKALQDRDVKLWPGNPAESRARLQAIVDLELPPLRAREELLRLEYEDPARAEAKEMALAHVTREELSLLHAERMHDQSYLQAVTGLLKVRKQTAAARAAAVEREVEETGY